MAADDGQDDRQIGLNVTDPTDTIFALSSGAPPAAIAVVRLSGPAAGNALARLCRRLPRPRTSVVRTLRDASGEPLDRAVVLWLPGPATSTGEDMAELHLHGGRAVVAAVQSVLAALPGLRPAQAGEFTRRALFADRLDLAEVEGLADLLQADTEDQRRRALRLVEGGLGRLVAGWRVRLLELAACCEAAIDHEEELDATLFGAPERAATAALATELRVRLDQPLAERLRDGLRIVIAGPVNAGKSSMLNALAARDAAIASPIEGTTRDLIEVPVVVDGRSFLLVDGAGLRDADDAIERIGVMRARGAIAAADLVLWLGAVEDAPDAKAKLLIDAKSDQRMFAPDPRRDIAVSINEPASIAALWRLILEKTALPAIDELSLNTRHRAHVAALAVELDKAAVEADVLIISEHLRRGMMMLDAIVGGSGPEQMLDALFARFCVGK